MAKNLTIKIDDPDIEKTMEDLKDVFGVTADKRLLLKLVEIAPRHLAQLKSLQNQVDELTSQLQNYNVLRKGFITMIGNDKIE